jgi:hypothetical protein
MHCLMKNRQWLADVPVRRRTVPSSIAPVEDVESVTFGGSGLPRHRTRHICQ